MSSNEGSLYAHFDSGNSFYLSDSADGTSGRLDGTYSVSGGKLTGSFTNPGVGDGAVEATISDNTIHLDFIEYWHSPAKVVAYTGVSN